MRTLFAPIDGITREHLLRLHRFAICARAFAYAIQDLPADDARIHRTLHATNNLGALRYLVLLMD